MKKRIRLIAVLVLAIITAALLWKFVSWATLSAKYAAFSISDLSPVWYYSSVILLAVLLMVVIWLVLQIVPKRQARALLESQKIVTVDGQEIDEEGSTYIPQSSIKPTELFTIENEARKTLSQIIGGFIVIVSLILTGANLAITSRLTQEGQITDRFTKAITQLGDKDKLEVRLGGIYALERIAKDSEKDHWTIMEVLSAYVRENAPRKAESSPPSSKNTKSNKTTPETGQSVSPSNDIQAILTVIGRRNITGEKNNLDLGNTTLRRANLRGTNLRQTNLRGTNLSEADLRGANLRRANLSEADLSGADLRGAIFSEADLSEANLSRVYLWEASLRGANLSQANLSRGNIKAADFRGANLSKADLSGADLWRANLGEAFLDGATLSGAYLNGAFLNGAFLDRANLRGANLNGADVRGAYFRGADLRETMDLTWEQISTAKIDDYTKLPPEIENQHKDELKAMREKTRKEREGK